METYALILILLVCLIAALSLSYICRRCYKTSEIRVSTYAQRNRTSHADQSLSTISSFASEAYSEYEIGSRSYSDVADRITRIRDDVAPGYSSRADYAHKVHSVGDYSSFGSYHGSTVSYRVEDDAYDASSAPYAESGHYEDCYERGNNSVRDVNDGDGSLDMEAEVETEKTSAEE